MNFGYYLIIAVIVYPFPLSVTILDIISSYLVCSNAQHKVTATILGRQFTIYFYQMLEAHGQAITDAAFCFGSVAQ